MRVWVWHNGMDQETLDIVLSMKEHPNFYRFYHSKENKKLTIPTNWLWENSTASFLTKVDDDCLMPYGWADALRQAHADNDNFGVIGCWRFPDEDFRHDIAEKKIFEYNGNHRIMRNCWIEGSGYLMKKECYLKNGILSENENFTDYCISLAQKGYINGWYYPFLYQEHFDDPRSSYTLLKTDEDMLHYAPLSAINKGIVTIKAWQAQLKRSAFLLQKYSYNPKNYTGWRIKIKNAIVRINFFLGRPKQW